MVAHKALKPISQIGLDHVPILAHFFFDFVAPDLFILFFGLFFVVIEMDLHGHFKSPHAKAAKPEETIGIWRFIIRKKGIGIARLLVRSRGQEVIAFYLIDSYSKKPNIVGYFGCKERPSLRLAGQLLPALT